MPERIKFNGSKVEMFHDADIVVIEGISLLKTYCGKTSHAQASNYTKLDPKAKPDASEECIKCLEVRLNRELEAARMAWWEDRREKVGEFQGTLSDCVNRLRNAIDEDCIEVRGFYITSLTDTGYSWTPNNYSNKASSSPLPGDLGDQISLRYGYCTKEQQALIAEDEKLNRVEPEYRAAIKLLG